MMPALKRPRSAMKNPIPADIASFIDLGMLSSIFILRPLTVNMRNSIPEMKTTMSPCSNVNPIPRQMVYDRKALTPIPGAKATGNLE